MSYPEEDLLPLSALSHLVFCERRAALIHIEQVWDENRFTVEGRLLHQRVHKQEEETRGDVRIARGLRLRSLRLGLSGMADVVEFHRVTVSPDTLNPEPETLDPERSTQNPEPGTQNAGIRLEHMEGLWRPYPVEYKRGRPKPDRCDAVQLCAQALCLEEMLNVEVPEGALFYGQPRRRLSMSFTPELRGETEALAERMHALHRAGATPPAVYEKKCDNCSLFDRCLPKATSGKRSVRAYLNRAFTEGPLDAEGTTE